MAEWRVSQRRMMPGETYADFAAALRDLCGYNRIRERVLLAQFYRSVDRTTRLLVKQRRKPTTLEEADTYVVPANGTTGHMALIPGVGSTEVAEEEKLACFTNSRGVYNKYLELWEAPKGRFWNRHMWAPVSRKRSALAVAPTTDKRMATAKLAPKAKVNMAVVVDSDYEEESADDEESDVPRAPPSPKRPRLATKQSKAMTHEAKAVDALRTKTEAVSAPRRFGELKCYACNQLGHLARGCPDDEARIRDDDYLARREQERKRQENEAGATKGDPGARQYDGLPSDRRRWQ